jgi:GNAT superfamily N-acetyltransferase
MKIIPANKKDHLEIIIYFQTKMALESENLTLSEELVRKGVEEVFDNPLLGTYLIYTKENKTLACLLIQEEWSDWRAGKVLWIHSVYVLPKYRNIGIFKEMYEYLKEIVLAEPKILGLRLYVDNKNQTAQKIYEKLGMESDHYSLYEWIKK